MTQAILDLACETAADTLLRIGFEMRFERTLCHHRLILRLR
jgi:hypothetical protein